MGKNTRKNKITKTRTLVNRNILQRKNKEIVDLKNEISNLKKYYSHVSKYKFEQSKYE